MQADSCKLCQQAVSTAWFDQRHFVLALIVVAERRQDLLARTFDVLDQLPAFVPLPPRDLRMQEPDINGDDGWVENAGCITRYDMGETMAKELQRQWSAAYLLEEGVEATNAQKLCWNVIDRWRAVWSCAHCGATTSAEVQTSARQCVLRHPSLRGCEWWQLNMLMLSGGLLDEQSLPGKAPDSRTLAAITLTYWEQRQVG